MSLILYPRPQTCPRRHARWGFIRFQGQRLLQHSRTCFQSHLGVHLYLVKANSCFSFLLSNSFNQDPRCQDPRPQTCPHPQVKWGSIRFKGRRCGGNLHPRPQTSPQQHSHIWGSIRFQGPRLLKHPRASFQCYLGVDLYLLKVNRLCSRWLLLVQHLSVLSPIATSERQPW